MLQTVLDVAVPVLVIFMMFVVGLSLTAKDFRRVGQKPLLVTFGFLGQWLLIPAVALTLIHLLPLQAPVAAGIFLIAICPAGGISNVYTYLVKANTALSVTLTALSCLSAVVFLPLWLMIYEIIFGEQFDFSIPVGKILGQLIVLVCIPVVLGMLAVHRYPDGVQKHEPLLRRVTLVGIASLLIYVIVQNIGQYGVDLLRFGPVSFLFMAFASALGWSFGWFCGLDARDRLTLAIEYPVRNLSIALVIAVTTFGWLEFASLAAAYFSIEILFMVLLFALFSKFTKPQDSGKSANG